MLGFKQGKLKFEKLRSRVLQSANFGDAVMWISAFVTGLVSVGYSVLFRWAEALFGYWGGKNHALIWILPPVTFILGWALVRFLAPDAGGSGIPQVLAANSLTGDKYRSTVNRLLSLKGAGIKVASSLVCLVGGGAIGREGPTVQISAAIFQFFRRFSRRIYPAHDARPWIVAGAAAGLASAFNTPLGGLVFAVEELGLSQFQKLRTPLIAAVIIAGLVAQWLHGNYLYLGFPALKPVAFSFLYLAAAVGVVGGLLGAVFGKLLAGFTQWTASLRKASTAFFIAGGCGLLVAAMAAYDVRAAGSGKDVIQNLLFHGQTATPLLVALRFASSLVTYGAGVAGGIFAPSLSIGAAIGSVMAQGVHSPHANLLIMLGMIAFLTGVIRAPFTSFVLVLEMTDRHSAIFPMMLAALAASAAAHFIDPKSFYEVMRLRMVKRTEPEDHAAPPQPETAKI